MANKKTSKSSKKKPGAKPASKEPTKTAGKTLAAGLAVGPCVTNGGRWESRVSSKGDGHFRVFRDSPQIDGDHSSLKRISGECKGDGMVIFMDASPEAGLYRYEGKFVVGNLKRIRNGTRTLVSFMSAMGLDLAPLPPGDPWEADKET
jgi:hypothetical protein